MKKLTLCFVASLLSIPIANADIGKFKCSNNVITVEYDFSKKAPDLAEAVDSSGNVIELNITDCRDSDTQSLCYSSGASKLGSVDVNIFMVVDYISKTAIFRHKNFQSATLQSLVCY